MSLAAERGDQTWLRVADVAAMLGVSVNTVRRWTDAGRLAAHRSPGGHRRYLAADVEALALEGEPGAAAPHPGEFADLRRQTQDMRAVMRAGFDLAALVSEAPWDVPEEVARRLCLLTDAPRCDVYVSDGRRLRLVVSVDGGEVDTGRSSATWSIREWLPFDGAPESLPAAVLPEPDGAGSPRGRAALKRRGCRALLWAPMTVHGTFLGAIELSDARARDLSEHLGTVTGLTAFCAHALDVTATRRTLEHRDKAVRELMDLSQEVAESPELETFAERFALRLMAAVNADCVDVWRVSGGVIRLLLDLTREGADPGKAGRILDTAKYPSLERTLIDLSPLIINDLSDPRLAPEESKRYREWGYASSLTMPLVSGGTLVGLVDLYDDAERDWSLELDFLTGLTQLVAGLFDNAVLLDEVDKRAQLQQSIVELAASLAGSGSLYDLALIAAGHIREATGAEDCDVWWLEEGFIRCLASYDSNGEDVPVRGRVLELARHSATAAALQTRETLLYTSPQDPRMTEEDLEDWAEFGFKSNISIPLVSADEVVGFIDVFDTRERDYNDVRPYLTSAARTAADALRNAHLLQSLQQSNAALRELVDLSDQLDEREGLEHLARIAAERVRAILSAEDCDIWGVDGEVMRCLASVDSRGWDAEEYGKERRLSDYPSVAVTLAGDTPVVIGDLAGSELHRAELAVYRSWGYRSMVTLPLVVEGRPIGLIDVFDTKVRDYTGQLDFIRNVGRLLAATLVKARLVERLESGNRDLRLLVDSGLEFGSTLDVDAVILKVAERILTVSQADLCDVYGADGPEVEVLAATGAEADLSVPGTRYRIADYSSFTEAALLRRPVIKLDVRNDPTASEHDRADAEEWGYASTMTVPLIAHGDLIGFIDLYNRKPRPFEGADTIVGLAQVAGQAIANARLYRELDQALESEQAANHETQLLNEIARRTAASLDLEEIVEAAVDELHKLIPFDGHSVYLAKDGVIEAVLTSDGPGQLREATDLGSLGAEFFARLSARSVLRMRLPDDGDVAARHRLTDGWRSATAIALPSDNGIMGAFTLASRKEDAFDSVDVHLLESVATQLSLAIKNAQLYDEIKQMHLGNLMALSSALNAKDYYTLGHAARVSAYTVMLGRVLGWGPGLMASLEEAAYLHDIGKISISDRVLLKPGRLNPQEWQQMRLHPVFSADIIRPLFPTALVDGVRHHHEHYDGTGYPDGLAGEDIPLLARAMAVVDAYDAMSCRRPYKAALSYGECLAELHQCRGRQFDPLMVDAFLGVLDALAETRVDAERIAAEAAGRIRGDAHRTLHSREDEDAPEYREICGILREVRDANPPTRYLTTHTRLDKKYVIGVDPEENEADKSHFGDEIFADDELPQVLDGGRPQSNTVYADQFGVWVTGLAPVYDAAGHVVAAVAADLPALAHADTDALRGNVRHTFATILQSAAVRLSRAEIESITDALTGLYNHRYLQERLTEELQRARDTGNPLTVLFCDLDHFKDFNDANGHSAGDRVLREVAHIIEQSVRNIDIAGRYGGEEFVVLLLETPHDSGLAVAERIRERIHAAGFAAHGTPLTASIGVAAYPDDADRREELLDKADWAMYLAKRRGRDQVASFSEG